MMPLMMTPNDDSDVDDWYIPGMKSNDDTDDTVDNTDDVMTDNTDDNIQYNLADDRAWSSCQ